MDSHTVISHCHPVAVAVNTEVPPSLDNVESTSSNTNAGEGSSSLSSGKQNTLVWHQPVHAGSLTRIVKLDRKKRKKEKGNAWVAGAIAGGVTGAVTGGAAAAITSGGDWSVIAVGAGAGGVAGAVTGAVVGGAGGSVVGSAVAGGLAGAVAGAVVGALL